MIDSVPARSAGEPVALEGLSPEAEKALRERARDQGYSVEEMAEQIIRGHLERTVVPG